MQGPQASLDLEPRNRRRLLVILLERGVALRELVPLSLSALTHPRCLMARFAMRMTRRNRSLAQEVRDPSELGAVTRSVVVELEDGNSVELHIERHGEGFYGYVSRVLVLLYSRADAGNLLTLRRESDEVELLALLGRGAMSREVGVLYRQLS